MEDVSKVSESALFPVDLVVHPYLLDHRSEGKVVLPAVEAMESLAAAVKRYRSRVDVSLITRARFPKFLYIDPGATHFSVFIKVTEEANGDVTASLLTKARTGKLAIQRQLEHATLCFAAAGENPAEPPADMVSALEEDCFTIAPETIYRDLVPFGASYQNIRDPLVVSKEGALAKLFARPVFRGSEETPLLGSPFPIDASFHAACAWGQRYAGVVAFPFAIERRVVRKPTTPGSTYTCRVVPIRSGQGLLTFDIWIHDERGDLCESACGVSMKDVSGGRVKPPEWVMATGLD